MGFQNLWSGAGGQLAAQLMAQPNPQPAFGIKDAFSAMPSLMQAQAMNEYRKIQAAKTAQEQKMQQMLMQQMFGGGGGQQLGPTGNGVGITPQPVTPGAPQQGQMEPWTPGGPVPSSPGSNQAAPSGVLGLTPQQMMAFSILSGKDAAPINTSYLTGQKQYYDQQNANDLGNYYRRQGGAYAGMPASALGEVAMSKPNEFGNLGTESDKQILSQKIAANPDAYYQAWDNVMNPDPKAKAASIAAFRSAGMTPDQAEQEFLVQSATQLAQTMNKIDPTVGAIVARTLGDNPIEGLQKLHKVATEIHKDQQLADVVYPAQAEFYNSGVPLRTAQIGNLNERTKVIPQQVAIQQQNANTNAQRANNQAKAQEQAGQAAFFSAQQKKFSNQISDIDRRIKDVSGSTTLSVQERERQLNQLRAQRDNLARQRDGATDGVASAKGGGTPAPLPKNVDSGGGESLDSLIQGLDSDIQAIRNIRGKAQPR